LAVYNKPHLSLADQLALLTQRGLQVSDEAAAIERLHRNGYYRLSAYWYPFRTIVENQRTNDFLPDSKFDDAHALCVFDKDFKLLLLDAIESVEIAVRAEIALHLGSKDIFAHTNRSLFRPSFITQINSLGQTKYETWLNKFNTAVTRSRDEFVLHHERKYGTRSLLPIWIAIELWDFGLLSNFYGGMDTPHCIAVATRFAIPNWRLMESWLRSLNYIRNVIAHHGRLWNINLVDSPKLPTKNGTIGDFDALVPLHNVNTRIYSICCILAYFSKVIDPQSAWPQYLIESIESFPQMPYASIQDMGFPPDWQSHSFWK
jgi:abortive infection bacteriophage resistance protein